jgi:hypothetical protein
MKRASSAALTDEGRPSRALSVFARPPDFATASQGFPRNHGIWPFSDRKSRCLTTLKAI